MEGLRSLTDDMSIAMKKPDKVSAVAPWDRVDYTKEI